MKAKQLAGISAVLFAFFIQGFCDIVGISAEYAREAFGWSHTMAGLLPSMVFVWFLVVSIPVGIKMNRWGRKPTVLLGMAVTVAGMLVPLLGTGAACLVGYAALGIGNAMLQVSQNALVRNVCSDERLLTSSITAGQVVKAVSSFCGPLFMLFAVNVLGGGNASQWYLVFPVLGAITLLSALWLWVTPIPREVSEASDVTVAATLSLLGHRAVLLLFLGIFFVVGIDVGTNFVSSKVMIDRFGCDVSQAGLAPQVYFVCRTVGALLGMVLLTRISSARYFRVSISGCIAVIVLLALCRFSATVTLGLIGAVGLLCSCIFPIIYAEAVRREPERANLVSGLMITAVAGGGAVTPFIGYAIDSLGGIAAGVSVLLVCAAYLAFVSFSSLFSHS